MKKERSSDGESGQNCRSIHKKINEMAQKLILLALFPSQRFHSI